MSTGMMGSPQLLFQNLSIIFIESDLAVPYLDIKESFLIANLLSSRSFKMIDFFYGSNAKHPSEKSIAAKVNDHMFKYSE